MPVEMKEVRTLADLKKFISFPYKLYKKHPYWVPPLFMDEMNTLRKDKNAAFDHCEACYWLAYKDNKIVGRIAGIINQVYKKIGITKVESNPELETNRLVQAQWKYYERRQHKRRRCYIKQLNEM